MPALVIDHGHGQHVVQREDVDDVRDWCALPHDRGWARARRPRQQPEWRHRANGTPVVIDVEDREQRIGPGRTFGDSGADRVDRLTGACGDHVRVHQATCGAHGVFEQTAELTCTQRVQVPQERIEVGCRQMPECCRGIVASHLGEDRRRPVGCDRTHEAGTHVGTRMTECIRRDAWRETLEQGRPVTGPKVSQKLLQVGGGQTTCGLRGERQRMPAGGCQMQVRPGDGILVPAPRKASRPRRRMTAPTPTSTPTALSVP